ncbi:HpsJ family protein [Altericista sp. CCNU0014]|uniref:HpsJ-like protein, cyanoexosortase A-associated n=1 Tax=Altericista sp. CCNU0014 TaxID=3082949 RepID=UPI00384B7F46
MFDKSNSQPRSSTIRMLRLVGYVLLLLSILDAIDLLIPPRFMNPEWEIQLITELVERVAVPLIGLALVFYKDLDFRLKFEILLLKGFSSAALVAGMGYLLLLPLLVVDTFRYDASILGQTNTLMDQRMTQIEQIEQRLSKAASKPELSALFSRFSGQALPPNLASQDFPSLKQELLETIARGKPAVRKQVNTAAQERRLKLFKTTVKAFLGAVISSFCFIYIWSLTRWIRRFQLGKAQMGQPTEMEL